MRLVQQQKLPSYVIMVKNNSITMSHEHALDLSSSKENLQIVSNDITKRNFRSAIHTRVRLHHTFRHKKEFFKRYLNVGDDNGSAFHGNLSWICMRAANCLQLLILFLLFVDLVTSLSHVAHFQPRIDHFVRVFKCTFKNVSSEFLFF